MSLNKDDFDSTKSIHQSFLFPNPAVYFPIERGIYEVTAGLKPLGFNFNQGAADQKVFQLCSLFSEFRKNKILCRKERLSKYFCQDRLTPELKSTTTKFIVDRLQIDYPDIFHFSNETLICNHTGDQIKFDQNYNLIHFESHDDVGPAITEALDALALQIQEDFALTSREVDSATATKKDRLSLLHLCSPSHWAAEDKIGKSFAEVHAPIPGIEKIIRAVDNMIEAMINKGPFVRFVWSFVTDQRLNHHPIAPTNWDQARWKGRSFDQEQKIPFHFRVERQVVYGLPQIDSSFFTIRISFIDGITLKNNPTWRDQLISALQSMSPESRTYKGVAHCFDNLLSWLKS